MFEIIKPKDDIIVSGLTILIYGEAGIGKTTLANTANNAVLIDFDNGAHRSAFRQDVIRIKSWSDISLQMNQFIDALKPYDTIIIDTAGKMIDYMIYQLEQDNPRLLKAQMQMYGELKKLFQDFHRKLKSLNKDIIFIAHVKEKDEGDFKIKRPLMAGSSYDIVVQSADLVGYMSILNQQTILDFRASEYIIAKNCGKLDFANVTGLINADGFMKKLIIDTKSYLNKQNEEQSESIKTIKKITTEFRKFSDVNEINIYLKKIFNMGLTQTEKLQVWKEIVKHTNSLNLKYNENIQSFE